MLGTILVSAVVSILIFDYRKTRQEVKALKSRPVMMAAPVGGFIDGILDGQIDPQILKRSTPAQILKGLEVLIALAESQKVNWSESLSQMVKVTFIPTEK